MSAEEMLCFIQSSLEFLQSYTERGAEVEERSSQLIR
jgi:hypothetical protein